VHLLGSSFRERGGEREGRRIGASRAAVKRVYLARGALDLRPRIQAADHRDGGPPVDSAPAQRNARESLTQSWVPDDHGTDNRGLQPRIARGLTWTIIDAWGRQLLGLVVFALLARLLLPQHFGLIALAAVFVGLAHIVVDQGLGDAIVQRRTLTRGHIDTAFWVALATGAILTVSGVVLAIPIATVLGEPELQPILQVLSFVFVLSALNSIQIALLRRELAFRSIALRTLLAIAGGGVVGIAMASAGAGAWALVGQQLAQAGLAVAVLWRVSPWRPGRQVSRQHFRELFSFGINIVGSDILVFVSRNADNLLIGALMGTTPLGIYAVAYRILDATGNLLVGIARRIAFPAFSRLHYDPDRLQRAYFRVARTSSALIVPGFVGLALVAPELIAVLFGPRWNESGPVAAILFMIGPILAVQSFSGSLLNAAGHPGVVFRFRLVTAITNVAGFLIAVVLFRDVIAVAVAYVVRGYLLLPLNLYLVRKHAAIPIGPFLLQMRGTAISTLAMAAAVLAVKLGVGDQIGNMLLLAIEVLVGAAAFLVALVLVERQLVGELLEVATQTMPGGQRARRRLGGRRSKRAAIDELPEVDTAAEFDTAADFDTAAPEDVDLINPTRGVEDV
jgi:O-antigen/teichoic acid export membrane protein